MKMPTYEVPRWMKLTAAMLPILATLFAVGSWANEKWMAETFITIAEAAETSETIIKRIEQSEETLVRRIEVGETKDTLRSIEMRLEIINLELSWLAGLSNPTSYHVERINFLRLQQQILLQRQQELQ